MLLVGGFNPFETSARQIVSFLQGWKFKKSLSCHHPDKYAIGQIESSTPYKIYKYVKIWPNYNISPTFPLK